MGPSWVGKSGSERAQAQKIKTRPAKRTDVSFAFCPASCCRVFPSRSVILIPYPLKELPLQLFLTREIKLVFTGVDIGVLRQGDLNQGRIFLLAENDADGVVLRFGFDDTVEVVHVHLHLPEILMGEFAELEVDEHVAAQKPVIENEIDEEVLFVEGESLLPRLEEEALT
jgi:hypothetical protein